MSEGVVKWFNNAKGFGFVVSEDGNEDLFAHYSAITMEGYKTLKAGQPVTFDVVKGEKGLHAVNIVAVHNTELSETSEATANSKARRTDTVDAHYSLEQALRGSLTIHLKLRLGDFENPRRGTWFLSRGTA